MIVDAVIALAAVYGAVTLLLFAVQRRLVFAGSFSRLGSPAESGVPEMRPVRYRTADRLELVAWYGAARDKPTIVYFHGNAGHLGDRADRARALLDRGYGLLLTSYRGYSGNPGRPTEARVYADARAALAHLGALGVAPDATVIYGESLGTGVAVQMAIEHAAAALVLEAPFTSLVDVASRHYWWAPVRWTLRDRFESAAKIAAIAMPVLIVHGERDRVVPVDLGRRLFAAAGEPKELRLFPDARHDDLYLHGADRAVDEFLRRRVTGPFDPSGLAVATGEG